MRNASRSSAAGFLRRFLRDRAGNAYVEFAIVGPLFLLLVCGVLENSLLLFAQATLDNGTRVASRLIQLGKASSSSTFSTQLCTSVGSLIPCGSLQFRVQSSSVGFSSMSSTLTTDGSGNMQNTGYSPGTTQQYVLVQVGYKRNFFIPWIGSIVSTTNSNLVVSTYAFQNEPY